MIMITMAETHTSMNAAPSSPSEDHHGVSHVFAHQKDDAVTCRQIWRIQLRLDRSEIRRSGPREEVGKQLQQMWKVLVPVPAVLTIASGAFEAMT